jgi:hypothetical protein
MVMFASGRRIQGQLGKGGRRARRRVRQLPPGGGMLTIADCRVRALHHGMSGAPGVELFGPWEERHEVRAAILEAGHPLGLRQVGYLAYPTTTLESGWVVDSSGRVHGTEGLRVADASIFPTIPRGYPHFIVIMAAEKIADAVKASWSQEALEAYS